jgi:hypothetical protein
VRGSAPHREWRRGCGWLTNPVAARALPGPNLDKQQRGGLGVLAVAFNQPKTRRKGDLTVGVARWQEWLERQQRRCFRSLQP